MRKDDCFVWSINQLNKIDKKTVGKWIIWGPKSFIESIFPKIDELVMKGDLYQAKYTHRENKDKKVDPFCNKEMMMCVYADDKTKENTLKILTALDIKPVSWKYDKQTERDWKPGGRLFEQAKQNG